MECPKCHRNSGDDWRQCDGFCPMPMSPHFKPAAASLAAERADWLLDAVAGATQDRRFLRGDPKYDAVAGEAIIANGKKAIFVAIDRYVREHTG